MPIPDGGWLWSPTQQALPEPGPAEQTHLAAAGLKISGMVLKQHYRAGMQVTKDRFRECLLSGESLLATGRPGGMHPASAALLETLSPHKLAHRRRSNHAMLLKRLPELAEYCPLGDLPEGCTPFALVLAFASRHAREHVRTELIARRIYPSILWDLPHETDPVTVAFGSRSLTLPCHYQYSEGDLEKLLAHLGAVLVSKTSPRRLESFSV